MKKNITTLGLISAAILLQACAAAKGNKNSYVNKGAEVEAGETKTTDIGSECTGGYFKIEVNKNLFSAHASLDGNVTTSGMGFIASKDPFPKGFSPYAYVNREGLGSKAKGEYIGNISVKFFSDSDVENSLSKRDPSNATSTNAIADNKAVATDATDLQTHSFPMGLASLDGRTLSKENFYKGGSGKKMDIAKGLAASSPDEYGVSPFHSFEFGHEKLGYGKFNVAQDVDNKDHPILPKYTAVIGEKLALEIGGGLSAPNQSKAFITVTLEEVNVKANATKAHLYFVQPETSPLNKIEVPIKKDLEPGPYKMIVGRSYLFNNNGLCVESKASVETLVQIDKPNA